MLRYIFLVFVLLCMINAFGKKRNSAPSNNPSSKQLETLRMARLTNRPLIADWIEQMNKAPNRPTITYWDFAKGSADKIQFTLLHQSEVREGILYFKNDRSCPRISQMVFTNAEGKTERFKGYIIQDYPKKVFKANLKAEKIDHIGYLNEVATKALKKGSATLDILKYDEITSKEFSELWNSRKLKAFCEMLVEEQDFATAKIIGDHQIEVTPVTNPI